MSRDFIGFMLVAAKLFVKKPENDKAKAPLSITDPLYWISTHRSGAYTPRESGKPSGELGPSKPGEAQWSMKKRAKEVTSESST